MAEFFFNHQGAKVIMLKYFILSWLLGGKLLFDGLVNPALRDCVVLHLVIIQRTISTSYDYPALAGHALLVPLLFSGGI